MQEFDRSKREESKEMRPQWGADQPTERLVQVRLALLNELEYLQKRLDAYLTGYISSRELSDLCAKVGSRLELGKQQKHRLWDPVYWEDVRDDLASAYERAIGLAPLIRADFQESVADFEKRLQELMTQVSGPMRSPEGADVISIASEALIAIGAMHLAIEPITVQSKQKADDVLKQVGHIIQRIREWIRVADEKSREPREQMVGYGDKLEQERIEGERVLRGRTRADALAPDVKTIRK